MACDEYTLHHATKLTFIRSKWPVIVGIILGSILALSIIWCVLKCMCQGIADCCCGCCSSRDNRHAYQQPPPPPAQYPMQNQYYGPQQPMYSAAPMYAPSPMYAPPQMSGGAGYRGAPTSHYEPQSPVYNNNKSPNFNEDALPAFPTHTSECNDVEMGHLQSPQAAQQQGLLSSHNNPNVDYYHGQPQSPINGDMGAMNAAPAHNYDSHRQFAPQSLYSQQDAAPTPGPNRVMSMRSTQYEPSQYPPSYHTQAPGNNTGPQFAVGGTTSPPPPFAGHTIGRKPVQGTWRDI